jgi:hypothetical protein
MDTVVSLAGGKLVATHYGFYNTIVGVGILVGNLATGSVLSAARRIGFSEILWAALILVGVIAALPIDRLDRAGRLRPPKGSWRMQRAVGPFARVAIHTHSREAVPG